MCSSDLPLANEALVRESSENFLLPNGTAGTNGALALPLEAKHYIADWPEGLSSDRWVKLKARHLDERANWR